MLGWLRGRTQATPTPAAPRARTWPFRAERIFVRADHDADGIRIDHLAVPFEGAPVVINRSHYSASDRAYEPRDVLAHAMTRARDLGAMPVRHPNSGKMIPAVEPLGDARIHLVAPRSLHHLGLAAGFVLEEPTT
jgi:hypothetical protein